MDNSDLDRQSNEKTNGDPLGQLIRAAGRRPAPPAAHYKSVRAASHAAWQAKLGARKQRRFSFALAASVVIALAAGVLLPRVWQPAPVQVAELAVVHGSAARFQATSGTWEPLTGAPVIYSGDRIRTDADSRLALALSNGVSLRVNANSDFELGSVNAIELVAGTIYVDSGDGIRTDPIRIGTAYGVVTDIGTQFEVRSSDESLRVRIRSGLVRLSESIQAADFESGEGKEFEVMMQGGLEERDFAPSDSAWEWAQTLAIPDPGIDTLGDYLDWISRETGISVDFDSAATESQIRRERLGGDVAGLSPLEVLDLIEAATDSFSFYRQDGLLEVRRH